MHSGSDITSKQASSGWHIALAQTAVGQARGNYLGDPHCVGNLVRQFVTDIFDCYDKVCDAEMSEAESTAKAKSECHRYAAIFAGADPNYVPMGVGDGAWNPAGVAQWIRGTLADGSLSNEAECDDWAAIRDAFAILVLSVYKLLTYRFETGDSDGTLSSAQGLVDDWTALMLGLPPETDIDDMPLDANGRVGLDR